MEKKEKIILDFDPGVDDITCLILAATDPKVEIELITIAPGNVSVSQSTTSTLHVLDLLEKDIRVVRSKQIKIEDAVFMHGQDAIGGYKLPKETKHKLSRGDVADEIYKLLLKYPKEITLLMCAPATNIAYLLEKHPDAKDLVKQVIFMGGSFGLPGQPDHISYNSRTNPSAYKKVIESGMKMTIVQSRIGRTKARFTEKQVEKISKMNELGNFLAQTFSTYWERGFEEKFVSHNDACTYLYLTRPDMFVTEKVDIEVDCEKKPGKLFKKKNPNSNISLIVDLKRKEFLDFMFARIEELSYLDMLR